MSFSPLISVIVPVYNSARYLAEALQSVRDQSYRNFEIIVVDDGSTDESARIAQDFVQIGDDARYFYQQNAGCGAARNAGILRARGELLAFLDSDDLWASDKLALQLAAWQQHGEGAAPTLIFGHAQQFFSPELSMESRASVRVPAAPQVAHLASALLISRRGFEAIGPYQSKAGPDIEWFLRARDAGASIHVLPQTLMFRRIHDCNTSRSQEGKNKDYAKLLKASLDRRRQIASDASPPKMGNL